MSRKDELRGSGDWNEHRLLVIKTLEDLQDQQKKTDARLDKMQRHGFFALTGLGAFAFGGKDLLAFVVKIVGLL